MAHQRHHNTAEQHRLTGQTLDFLVGSAEAHRERRSMSFAARVFDPDLRGLATEPLYLDDIQFLSAFYRIELAVEVSHTYFAKSKGILKLLRT